MKLAVFYHCLISGGSVPINTDFALNIIAEQMHAFKKSGLADAAEEFVFAVNGDEADGLAASSLAPAKAKLVCHGRGATTEIPTMNLIRAWLLGHDGWNVLYAHQKGVTQPNNEFHQHHRRVMEQAVVANWRTCVKDLERGYDAVGVNLVHPIKRPVLPGRFYAGNFWVARADYLLKLPPLPVTYSWANRCMAELWIGSGPGKPKFMDYERPALYPL
jgi:hypothetical protein